MREYTVHREFRPLDNSPAQLGPLQVVAVDWLDLLETLNGWNNPARTISSGRWIYWTEDRTGVPHTSGDPPVA